MSRIFRPSESLIVEAEDVQHTFRTDRPAIQYIRRSSSNQVKNSLQSKIQQDEATERKLRAKGFTIIRKISLDDGKSGQKLIIEREGIQQLYHAIQHDDPRRDCILWRKPSMARYNACVVQRFHPDDTEVPRSCSHLCTYLLA